MLFMNLKKFIESINIPVYSISNITEFGDFESDLIKYNENNPLEFCSETIDKRLSAKSILPSVKNIVTLLIPYELENGIEKDADVELPSIVSNNAWEIDYHTQLKEKLNLVADYLKSEYDDLEFECVVDTSPLIDRIVAYKAGIGCYGKNTFLINEKIGSSFYIGSLLINKCIDEVDRNSEVYKNCDICKNCDLCVKYCPGHALSGNYTINSKKCVSYLTQKKGILTYDERKLIGSRLYGCDICQNVCPYSKTKFIIGSEYKRTSSNIIDASELINTSNKQLRKKYKLSGFIWRGPNILKRNAIVIIGNSGKENGYKFLEDYYFELSIEHRLYALWSMYNINEVSFNKYIKVNDMRFSDEEKLEIFKLQLGKE